MKLESLTKEELITCVREKAVELDEEKLVYEVLKKREKVLREKLDEAEKREKETQEWFCLFLKQFPCKEVKPGRKEYYVPLKIMKENEDKIKEYNNAHSEWWRVFKEHCKAFDEMDDAFHDIYDIHVNKQEVTV